MQNRSWMQPAHQVSEAVLLPALERKSPPVSRFGKRYLPPALPADTFLPVDESWGVPPAPDTPTYIQPRGSMAGRSVLRAAGVQMEPVWRRPKIYE